MPVLAVVSDLFFVAKVNEAARMGGVKVDFAATVEKALELAKGEPSLVVIDLNCNGINAVELISRLRAQRELASSTLVGFVSHVQADLRQAALEAGCDLVLPRSAFSRELPELVTRSSKKAGGI
jgi:CheY-like chemotaxis protein